MKNLNTLKKIGIIGTQSIGKTTLVKDMIEKWPQFSVPEKSYRDLIKEKNLSINKNGNKESQDAIMGVLVEQSLYNYGKKISTTW